MEPNYVHGTLTYNFPIDEYYKSKGKSKLSNISLLNFTFSIIKSPFHTPILFILYLNVKNLCQYLIRINQNNLLIVSLILFQTFFIFIILQ